VRSHPGTGGAERGPAIEARPRLRNLPVPEQTLACLALGLWWRHRRGRRALPTGVALSAGALTIAAGTGLVVQAWRAAGDVMLSEPDAVVSHGPFARSRNPMYLGWGLMHLGLGVLLRSPEVLATVPPAWALLHRDVVREERDLEVRLGQEYAEYRRAVPRYLRFGPGPGTETSISLPSEAPRRRSRLSPLQNRPGSNPLARRPGGKSPIAS